MPVNLYWIIIAKEPYHYQSVPISFALLYNVVFIMSVLVFINSLLRRFFRKGTLSQGELLTIHVILCFTTTVGGGHDADTALRHGACLWICNTRE